MQHNEKEQNPEVPEKEERGQQSDNSAGKQETSDVSSESEKPGSNDEKLTELNDKYLRLYSEFDNYRKRTVKERSEIIKTAAEDVLKALLPAIDDFERAIRANEKADDISAVKQGMQLIYNKLKGLVTQKGLQAFESKGMTFDPDLMEAITHVPAEKEEDRNKVIDEVEKGYKLGDKVVRYAKVVVAK